MRCTNNAFSSNFDALTEIFSVISAFCEAANPNNIWKETRTKLLTDFRRRNVSLCHEIRDFEIDRFAEVHVLNEIQMSLYEISPFLDLETVGLPKLPPDFSSIAERTCAEVEKPNAEENVKSATESFNKDHVLAFNIIVGEILPVVSDDDPYRHVTKPFSHASNRSRGYFLDAPGGTGKTFTIRAIQSMLRMREQKVIAVATPAVAASLLEGSRTAHSVFKIPIPCFSESVCNTSLDFKLARTIRQANLIIWYEIVM